MQIELTPNGKTLVCVYPSNAQGMLIASCLQQLGEPEVICPGEADPNNVFMLFPHQDMSEDLREAAERMTTAHLLDSLGFNKGGEQ